MVPPLPEWERPSAFFDDGAIEMARGYFKRGLEELGLTLETFPRLVLSFNKNHEHPKIAEAIQQQWKEAFGITVELESCDWKAYLSKISAGDYQIARSAWVGDFSDPMAFLAPFKYKDGSVGSPNETGWENAYYALLLDQANTSADRKSRKEYLQEAEKILIEEMPVIPIYFIVYHTLKKPHVHDIYLSPLGMLDLKYAHLESTY